MEFALWADGTVCELDEVEEMLNAGWSDDFQVLAELPPDLMEAMGW